LLNTRINLDNILSYEQFVDENDSYYIKFIVTDYYFTVTFDSREECYLTIEELDNLTNCQIIDISSPRKDYGDPL